MKVEIESAEPESVEAELLAVPFDGALSAGRAPARRAARRAARAARRERRGQGGRRRAGRPPPRRGRADRGDDASRSSGRARRTRPTRTPFRTAAAAAVRAANGVGGTVVWCFDGSLALEPERQVAAVVEGAVLGGHDPARWKTGATPARAERLVLAGAPAGLEAAAARAAVVARWTNRARELVDGPPNEVTPAGLAAAAVELLEPLGVTVEVARPGRDRAGSGSAGSRRSARGSAQRAAADRPPLPPRRRAAGARARRQVGHLRLGRLLPEAAGRHRQAEGRHGRRRGGDRRDRRDRGARAAARRARRPPRRREHDRRRRVPARATSSRPPPG